MRLQAVIQLSLTFYLELGNSSANKQSILKSQSNSISFFNCLNKQIKVFVWHLTIVFDCISVDGITNYFENWSKLDY